MDRRKGRGLEPPRAIFYHYRLTSLKELIAQLQSLEDMHHLIVQVIFVRRFLFWPRYLIISKRVQNL